MRHILDSSHSKRIDYFDSCRRKRNTLDYDIAGLISDTEANELVEQAADFRKIAEDWIQKNYPDLAG